MVPAVHNYWLGIMALAFAIAIVAWIGLVFWADRHPHGYQQDTTTSREVMGGSFVARDGGRQVVPDPREPLQRQDAQDAENPVPSQRQSADPPAARTGNPPER